MEKEILEDAIELITKECKDNIEIGKNYEQYLEEMTDKSLNDTIALYATMQYDDDKLRDIHIVLEQDKLNKIEYLKENIKEILNLEIELFPKELLESVNDIIKKDGYVEYTFDNMQLLINYIVILRKLGFVYTNISNRIIKIHMPREILEIVKDKINSEEMKAIEEEKEFVIEFVEGLLNAYGMISIMEAYILITKLYRKVVPETFNRYIFFISNILHIKFKADDVYLYNINLLDEEIPELGEIHSGLEYNFYSLEDIKLLAKNEYYVKYMQYKALEEFAENKLNIPIDIIKLELVDWYIVLAQMDYDDAEDYMMKKLDEFEIKEKYKEQIKQYVRDIYEICPKWKLKGGIKYKKNNDIKILKFPQN